MGQINHDQGQLFYSFNLEEVVPDDHLIRSIARVLDFSWVRAELAPHYSHTGRPSIDDVVGYVSPSAGPSEMHGKLVQLRMTCHGFVGGHETLGCLTAVETFGRSLRLKSADEALRASAGDQRRQRVTPSRSATAADDCGRSCNHCCRTRRLALANTNTFAPARTRHLREISSCRPQDPARSVGRHASALTCRAACGGKVAPSIRPAL